jgi:hypothetical protein
VGVSPALKALLKMLQYFSKLFVRNRQDACSTKSKFSCGVGVSPALKALLKMLQYFSKLLG